MRQSLEESWLRLVRLYTFYSPIRKGKYRLYEAALRLCRERPRSLPASSADGRRFVTDLTTGMQDTLFFLGEYERYLTGVAERLINTGDICVDVGANFGWYTGLMSKAAGPRGAVHAFEPVPRSFEELRRNVELLKSTSNVTLNNLALGDEDGTVEIHLFDNLTTGEASMAAKPGMASHVVECQVTSLDSYMKQAGVDRIDFLKVDVEGAEMMFLNGATRVFEAPPVIMMEMAIEQTRNFGYAPNDLLAFIAGRADYTFFMADEVNRRLIEFDRFPAGHIGANVFCIPADSEQLKRINV